MAQHPIILGQYPGDKKGDPARVAGGKINQDFGELFAAVGNLSGLTLVAGPVTNLAPGANPTASLTGTAPNYTLSLGLPEGAPGAGAPNSADILAIAEKGRLERALAAAGVPDEPSLILDFIRGVYFAKGSVIAASLSTLLAALGPSFFTRGSTATYFDRDGLLKTAGNNAPRLGYDPVTRLPRGLVVESLSKINRNTYSEQLDHTSYSKARCSVVADALADPFGTVTMDKVVEDTTATNSHYIYRNVGMGLDNASEQCLSMFLRPAGRTRGRLFFCDIDTLGRQVWVDFDLSAGTVGTIGVLGGAAAGTAGIENLGGGLYRVFVAGTLGGGTSTQPRLYLADATGGVTYSGDGTSGMGSWGWQLEINSRPSTYARTGASAVTRSGDSGVIFGPQWIGAVAGGTVTVVFEVDLGIPTPTSTFAITFQNSAGADYLGVREGGSAPGWDFYTAVANSGVINSGGYAATPDAIMRFAFGLDASSYAFAANNALSHTGGATTLPSGIDRMRFAGSSFMGNVRRIIVYPQRLSNTKVQALSNQAAWS